jgi:hypothetical protein
MKQKIKSISEAFSQQPHEIMVLTLEQHESTIKYNPSFADRDCKEIKLETITVGFKYGHPVDEIYYVGYNFSGHEIFRYVATSVNVHFENTEI